MCYYCDFRNRGVFTGMFDWPNPPHLSGIGTSGPWFVIRVFLPPQLSVKTDEPGLYPCLELGFIFLDLQHVSVGPYGDRRQVSVGPYSDRRQVADRIFLHKCVHSHLYSSYLVGNIQYHCRSRSLRNYTPFRTSNSIINIRKYSVLNRRMTTFNTLYLTEPTCDIFISASDL